MRKTDTEYSNDTKHHTFMFLLGQNVSVTVLLGIYFVSHALEINY